jgi:eukaryotic-like serine/threonine-protein kinase
MGVDQDPNQPLLQDEVADAPRHQVCLTDFWIDQLEVTNLLYRQCVDMAQCSPPRANGLQDNPHYYDNVEFENYPVVNVTWEDAVKYCSSVGRRLPTEAEWEKAATWNAEQGAKYPFPWGEEFDPSRLNYCDRRCKLELKFYQADSDDGFATTSPVGHYPEGKSPYGALDMAGNVWEWTSSLRMAYPYEATDGREDSTVEGERIIRGGAWSWYGDRRSESTWRVWLFPEGKSDGIGFRCATSTLK